MTSSQSPIDYQPILQKIAEEIKPLLRQGDVAGYIPELAKVDPEQFGMALYCLDGQEFSIGTADERFSVQSITKLFAVTLAYAREHENIWKRVGREASGSPFDSLWQLEYERGIPRNPFINAGALVVTDILLSHEKRPDEAVLDLLRMLSNQPLLDFDPAIAESEYQNADRNHAIAYLMKAFGNIRHSVESLMRAYCRQCSIKMSCIELARAGSFLAQHGTVPWNRQQVLSRSAAKRINSLMVTCGTYDSAGEFAYRIGLPAKSGVGGGILAIIPDQMAIAVWSPRLDESGNSLVGTYALERFTSLTTESIF
jgi:glutaminase